MNGEPGPDRAGAGEADRVDAEPGGGIDVVGTVIGEDHIRRVRAQPGQGLAETERVGLGRPQVTAEEQMLEVAGDTGSAATDSATSHGALDSTASRVPRAARSSIRRNVPGWRCIQLAVSSELSSAVSARSHLPPSLLHGGPPVLRRR